MSKIPSELKYIMVIVAILISFFMAAIASENRMEISTDEYNVISRLKDKMDSEPTHGGYDPYRKWLKEATDDNYISRKELRNFGKLSDEISKENIIYKLRK